MSPSTFIMGNSLVPVVMFGWIPIVLCIFAVLPPARAAIVSFLFAWLFLPMATFHLQGLPPYTKMSATVGGVLLAAMVFDVKRLGNLSFCPSWIDIPMIIWCVCPLATALANDPELTAHDGTSWMIEQIFAWALPYLIGRVYFSNLKSLRELAIGVFVGGLIYIPFCLFEMKMSPILHQTIYGFLQRDLAQSARDGSWRPMVFMQHGLAVGLFMCCAALSGLWLWRTREPGAPRSRVMPVLVFLQTATAIACRSTGATILFVLGILLIFLTDWTKKYLLLFLVLLVPPTYVFARAALGWNGEVATSLAMSVAGARRSASLDFRLQNEEKITAHTMQKLWFGWGGYARAFPMDENGVATWTPDSLWIIAFGTWGAVGITALLCIFLPIPVMLWRVGPSVWGRPEFSGAAIFTILLLLYSIDNLVNNMPNPIFLVGLGGLSGLVVAMRPVRVSTGGFVEEDWFSIEAHPAAMS